MKKLSIFAGLLAAVAVSVSVAQAAVTTNDKYDVGPFATFVPCANGGAGELVVFEATEHVVVTSTVNGNNVSGKFHGSDTGSGTGLTTGDKYQMSGVTNIPFKDSLQNGQFMQTFVSRTKFTGQGPSNNLVFRSTFHVTINANGEVTVVRSESTVECT